MLEINGLTAQHVGETAAANAIVLHELMPLQASLEEAFMELTQDEVEYKASRARRHDGDRARAAHVAAPRTRSARSTQARVDRSGVDEAPLAALDALVAAESRSS